MKISSDGLHVVLLSLHGLIRAEDVELGRDADTGGQIKYVLEMAAELGRLPGVSKVELMTRQIFDSRVSDDYSQLEEPITDNAKIVRLPFGPKRYLRKEALWPYTEVFVDQALSHFRRNGLPDLIHGHYADAGYCGAQLARLLGIPYVFTGHSLGRVKKSRLVAGGGKEADLEKKYKLSTRIEAEEMALETASMVVASTAQEVEDQYEVYEHYVPSRMEVIPPGVDLTAFHPPADGDTSPVPFQEQLAPFLREPDKPMIVTVARPDERKNLESLVRVYGQSEELQKRANLVIVMGRRDDLADLSTPQRKVVINILSLIDLYDLYGKVAYPKTHQPSDVPDLYRMATSSRGVFVNPALTEPFGLTLLEAAASGLPVVATNDGGPRDIIANCQNGLLIDPLDLPGIEKALLRMLTEPKQWDAWSKQGMEGAHKHYTWGRHAERYLRDVREIVEKAATPVLVTRRTAKRIPEFDRLILTDLDNTLTGDDEALKEFGELIRSNDHVGFGVSTGRSLEDAREMIDNLGLPTPDLLDTAVGTELYYGKDLHPDISWRKQINFQWDAQAVHDVLEKIPGFFVQSDKEQSEFKVSYKIDIERAPKPGAIRRILREAGLRVRVVISLGIYVDVVPVRAGSESSLRHLIYRWGFAPEQLLVAGDSGNDEGMLKGRTLGVVVGNYSPELEKLRKNPRVYFAEGHHAQGILEGIQYYHFLDHIVIPNDRIEE